MKKYYIKYGDFIYCVKNRKVRVVKDISELNDWGTPCDLTDKMPFEDILKYIKEFIDVVDNAIFFKQEKNYDNASREFEKAADILEHIGDKTHARNYYAYAAIMKENSEKWRSISYLWYKASGKMENTKDYIDFNSLQHTYPTISIEKWESFEDKEKIGRAIQYAAYSEDNFGGPTDSYWLFEEAVDAYKIAGKYGRMIECLISATNRYVKLYNKVSDKLIILWEDVLQNKKMYQFHEKLIILAFDEIYKNMNQNESEKAKFFYIESKKLQIRVSFMEHHYLKGMKDFFSGLFSDFGTSIFKIISQVVLIVVGVFPWIFMRLNRGLTYQNAIINSINNFLGIEYISYTNKYLYFVGIVEILYSYFILVVISTYVINSVVRDMN